MSPRDGESARQSAPETVDHLNRYRQAYHCQPTPLQVLLAELETVFQHAREELGERGFDCLLDLLTIRVAREQRLRLTRREKRAA